MMTVEDLSGALTLIGIIGAIYGGLWILIQKAMKPIRERLEHIDEKMVSRKSVQTVLSMQTREIVGLKRKVMPTVNALKIFLSSKGIKINNKNGEYIGDLSELYDLSEDEFINKIRIILDEFNDEV